MSPNFIIIHSENTGSSPLVSLLSQHENAKMGIYEEFDCYNFGTSGLTSEQSQIFIKLFRYCLTGQGDLVCSESSVFDAIISKIRLEEIEFSKSSFYGFKWRPWLPNQLGYNVFHEIFTDLSTLPILLYIKDPLFYGLKILFNLRFSDLYFAEPCRHLQFKFIESLMDKVEFSRWKKILSSFTFEIEESDVDFLVETIDQAAQFLAFNIEFLKIFSVTPLLFESEYLKTNLALTANTILKRVGSDLHLQPFNASASVEGHFRQAGMRSIEQCTNLKSFLYHHELRRCLDEYEKILNTTNAFLN